MLAWALDAATNRARNGSRLNLVALMRFDPEALSQATRPYAAEGVVAYSALCTHAGCDLTDWLDDRELLSCDCHSALFDPKDAGKVIDGPAQRALPALALKIVDGRLAVAKGFASAIKFESP
jgi:Rieske Fe-S protein